MSSYSEGHYFAVSDLGGESNVRQLRVVSLHDGASAPVTVTQYNDTNTPANCRGFRQPVIRVNEMGSQPSYYLSWVTDSGDLIVANSGGTPYNLGPGNSPRLVQGPNDSTVLFYAFPTGVGQAELRYSYLSVGYNAKTTVILPTTTSGWGGGFNGPHQIATQFDSKWNGPVLTINATAGCNARVDRSFQTTRPNLDLWYYHTYDWCGGVSINIETTGGGTPATRRVHYVFHGSGTNSYNPTTGVYTIYPTLPYSNGTWLRVRRNLNNDIKSLTPNANFTKTWNTWIYGTQIKIAEMSFHN
jgi:hypothetical protein